MQHIERIDFPKMGLLASLYISQYIPLMFFYEALPVYLRQRGSSLEAIALVNLLILPVVLKFLWSPLIDRYGFTRWGHYRFWIVLFQVMVSLLTLACAFIDIEQNLNLLLIIGFVMCVFCTSQDIAADALAVNLLTPEERGLGNGIQVSGHYLGAVIGSGGMLILLDRLAWQKTLLLIALIMVISLLPILLHQEVVTAKPVVKASISKELAEFFGRRELWLWLLILATYTTGSSMAITMFRPLLVDLGLSTAQIGLLLGVVSYGVGTIGALIGGMTVNFLDRKKLLMVGGCLQGIVILGFLLPAWGISSLVILYLLGITFNGIYGVAETATSTIKMDKSSADSAGRDFTIRTSIAFISSAIAGSFSGTIAEAVGYSGLFVLCVGLTLGNLLLISRLKV
ncbi:MFS transporter [Pleurocapsa sp. CCALA 161]|uniref:MFS transporter n=1 Tax=Pleurocapsa sp. CCALA 161 TaxID=2107688 RepID=UPI0011B23BFF|nr:MFS transporter [Pleurocapsa sp. CCALA 161]